MKRATRGVGDKALDIGGTMPDKPTPLMHFSGHGFYNESNGFEDDAKELASDWSRVQQHECK